MPPENSVSLVVHIPQDIQDEIQLFLSQNIAWEQDDFAVFAFSWLLIQSNNRPDNPARTHLQKLIKRLEKVA